MKHLSVHVRQMVEEGDSRTTVRKHRILLIVYASIVLLGALLAFGVCVHLLTLTPESESRCSELSRNQTQCDIRASCMYSCTSTTPPQERKTCTCSDIESDQSWWIHALAGFSILVSLLAVLCILLVFQGYCDNHCRCWCSRSTTTLSTTTTPVQSASSSSSTNMDMDTGV